MRVRGRKFLAAVLVTSTCLGSSTTAPFDSPQESHLNMVHAAEDAHSQSQSQGQSQGRSTSRDVLLAARRMAPAADVESASTVCDECEQLLHGSEEARRAQVRRIVSRRGGCMGESADVQ